MNKKVLLYERKRHTARRVVSTPSVVLTGYPPVLVLGGTLPGGYPTWVPPGRVPPGAGYPPGRVSPGQGTPSRVATPGRVPPSRVPPWQGTPPCLPHGILGNVAKHCGIWVPPPLWTDRLMDGRTDACQNITFPSYYVRGR